jgi:hypothetical protein
MSIALLALLIAAVVFLGAHIRGRAHTIIEFSNSGVELRRGSPPQALLRDLGDLRVPEGAAVGRLEIRGQGETLELSTHALSDELAQRVRNVVLLRKAQLRR